MLDKELLRSIDEKLGMTTRLLALLVLDGKSKTDAVNLLGSAGLDRNSIAELVGTTPLTVSVIRSGAKKESRRKRQKPISEPV